MEHVEADQTAADSLATGAFVISIWGFDSWPAKRQPLVAQPWVGAMGVWRFCSSDEEDEEERMLKFENESTLQLWEEKTLSLTVEQLEYIYCGSKIHDAAGC